MEYKLYRAGRYLLLLRSLLLPGRRLTGIRPEALLKLEELAHEVEVRGDDGAGGLDQLVSFNHAHPPVLHDIGDGYRRRSRDTSLAVDQHAAVTFLRLLYEGEGLLEVLLDVLLPRV